MSTYEDSNLAVDESRRIAQHEAVKDQVRGEVNGEIARNAADMDAADRARADALAEGFKDKAIREVADTEVQIEQARGAARVSQIVDYCFFLVYSLIGLEILLDLLGASERSGFKQFVDTISAPFLAPFHGLMPTPTHGPFKLMLSYVFALVAYLILHLAVTGLLRLFAHRKVAI